MVWRQAICATRGGWDNVCVRELDRPIYIYILLLPCSVSPPPMVWSPRPWPF